MNSHDQGIPSVDLSDFTSGDPERKEKFVQELGEAYEKIGFAAVQNHGIDAELIDELYDQVKSFFDLPEEVKMKYEPENAGQRGYVSFGREHAKNRNAGDLKEFWHFGQYVEEKDDPIAQEYPDNLFVEELPRFNLIGKQAYKSLEHTGVKILRAIALYLGLEENYFDDKVHNGNSILRPIHYPPIEDEPKDAVRAGEHEDINLITLLIGASADGLQVLNKKGEWVSVTALPGRIVVNVGDMLQRLTNKKLVSTTHRVINPPREQWGTSRYSIPFFLHPRSNMKLDCLKSCIDDKHPKQFEDITAGEYLNERLKEIGLKKD